MERRQPLVQRSQDALHHILCLHHPSKWVGNAFFFPTSSCKVCFISTTNPYFPLHPGIPPRRDRGFPARIPAGKVRGGVGRRRRSRHIGGGGRARGCHLDLQRWGGLLRGAVKILDPPTTQLACALKEGGRTRHRASIRCRIVCASGLAP